MEGFMFLGDLNAEVSHMDILVPSQSRFPSYLLWDARRDYWKYFHHLSE